MIKINNAKMANLLIKDKLVLDHILHRYMKYNPTCKVKQCFKYYGYDHVSVYC